MSYLSDITCIDLLTVASLANDDISFSVSRAAFSNNSYSPTGTLNDTFIGLRHLDKDGIYNVD